MKNINRIFLAILLIVPFITSCDENDPTPGYEVVGRSYETIADVSVSNEEPIPGETITVTLYYVNYSQDAAQSVTLIEDRNGSQTTLNMVDESNAAFGERTINYTYEVPDDASGEDITFIGEFRSNKEFPQVEVASIEVQ